MAERPVFPVVPARKDIDGNFHPVSITEELTIRDGFVRLSEVPDMPSKGFGGVTIPGMTEVTTQPRAVNTFRVNYSTGRVYFTDANEEFVISATYGGKGSLVATDEINDLWKHTRGSYSFIGLEDTPDSFTANAYIRTNSTGTALINDIPTIGRALSRSFMHDFSTDLVFDGSQFDIISLYSPESSTAETRNIVMPWSGDGTESAGNWLSGATGTATFGPFKTYDVAELVSMSATYDRGAGLRFCALIRGGYYKVDQGSFRFISNTQPDIGSVGSDVSEMAAITDRHIREFPGEDISFVFAGANATLSTVWAIHGIFGGGWKQVIPSTIVFDSILRKWTIKTAVAATLRVVVGSGRDELACTSDIIQFEHVKPGDTCVVGAPVQTLVNVLYADFTDFTQATPGVDVDVVYNPGSLAWIITSKLPGEVTLQVAVAGNAWKTQVNPVWFSELADGVSLDESTPKTLVAHDNRIRKFMYIHPYLL